jgi:hypothetical protein
MEKENANSPLHAVYSQTQATLAHIQAEATAANTEN